MSPKTSVRLVSWTDSHREVKTRLSVVTILKKNIKTPLHKNRKTNFQFGLEKYRLFAIIERELKSKMTQLLGVRRAVTEGDFDTSLDICFFQCSKLFQKTVVTLMK